MMAGLVVTNPGPEAFEDYAAERLVDLAIEEVCRPAAMPMLLRLVVRNCGELVRSQRQVFGRLVAHHSRRINFGIASLYLTRLGGQQVLPDWRIPIYSVTTLAAAGQFVTLSSEQQR